MEAKLSAIKKEIGAIITDGTGKILSEDSDKDIIENLTKELEVKKKENKGDNSFIFLDKPQISEEKIVWQGIPDMERAIIPLVEAMLGTGVIQTLQSCCGHKIPPGSVQNRFSMPNAWVQFEFKDEARKEKFIDYLGALLPSKRDEEWFNAILNKPEKGMPYRINGTQISLTQEYLGDKNFILRIVDEQYNYDKGHDYEASRKRLNEVIALLSLYVGKFPSK